MESSTTSATMEQYVIYSSPADAAGPMARRSPWSRTWRRRGRRFPTGSRCWSNRDERRWALAHDFHEAYIGDLCRPMLQALGAISASAIEAIEDLKVSLDLTVAARFGLTVTHEIEQRVSVVDDLLLKVEMQFLGLATKTNPRMRDGEIIFPWNGQVWEPAHCVRELYLEMARLEMI